jgi:hypothetical protein
MNLDLVKDWCRQIAQEPGALTMIQIAHAWPGAGIAPGAYVVFEKRPVPLNGRWTVVARLIGRDYHYVGRAERIIKPRGGNIIRLSDSTTIPEKQFFLQGPVVMVVREGT